MANLSYFPRPLIWMSDARTSLVSFPKEIRQQLGVALRVVQNGEVPPIAKPLSGLGSGVYELKASGPDNTYRVVYLVKLKQGVYVIDAFVKKAKRGREVPKEVRERLVQRLRAARRLDEGRLP